MCLTFRWNNNPSEPIVTEMNDSHRVWTVREKASYSIKLQRNMSSARTAVAPSSLQWRKTHQQRINWERIARLKSRLEEAFWKVKIKIKSIHHPTQTLTLSILVTVPERVLRVGNSCSARILAFSNGATRGTSSMRSRLMRCRSRSKKPLCRSSLSRLPRLIKITIRVKQGHWVTATKDQLILMKSWLIFSWTSTSTERTTSNPRPTSCSRRWSTP